MKILNIHCHTQNENVIIKLVISTFSKNNVDDAHTISENFFNLFYYTNSALYDNDALSHIVYDYSDDEMVSSLMGKNITLHNQSLYYTLPSNTHLGCNLLLAINDYVLQHNFDNIQFNPYPQAIFLRKNLDQYLQQKSFTASTQFKELLTQLLLIEKPSHYTEIHKNILTLYTWSNHYSHMPVSECFILKNRLYILNCTLSGLSENTPNVSAINYYVRACIQQFHHENKVALFRSCIGKKAYDGDVYDWCYNEWDFIRYAEFNIRSDGKISITHISQNPAYLFYIQNNVSLNLYEQEIQHLFMTLDLELDHVSNLQHEIVFTQSSSQKLITANMHINLTYLQHQTEYSPPRLFSAEKNIQGLDYSFIPNPVLESLSGLFYPYIKNNNNLYDCNKAHKSELSDDFASHRLR